MSSSGESGGRWNPLPTEPTPHRSEDELLALVRRKAAAIHYRRRVGALGAGALTLLLIAGGIALAGNGDNAKRTVHVAGVSGWGLRLAGPVAGRSRSELSTHLGGDRR